MGAPTLGQSGPGNDGNEGALRIPQSSNITGTSPLDCLMSYPGHNLEPNPELVKRIGRIGNQMKDRDHPE